MADIQIMEAPRLAKIDDFNTNLLSVDNNTPLARAINARKNQDPFLRDFGRPDASLNERDQSTAAY